MSGSFTPTAQLYNRFYFTPEGEPCEARYLFDKALIEEEGREDLKLDINDFPSYIKCLERNDRFKDLLTYEKIEIIEKEEDPAFAKKGKV